MPFLDGALARDAIIVLAWAATMAWLKLCAAAARIGCLPSGRLLAHTLLGAPDPAVKVGWLAYLAERGVWRCETLAALNADAYAAVAQAQDDYAQALAQFAAATLAAQSRA